MGEGKARGAMTKNERHREEEEKAAERDPKHQNDA
jgi:hypothetical protein